MIIVMLLIPTVASMTLTITHETIQPQATKAILYQPTLFDWWGVDQQQIDHCGHGIILTPPSTHAQSFTPTKDKLTAVRLYMFKYGAPPEPVHITVSIRDNLTGADLTTKTIDTTVVSIGIGNDAKWVLFDFKDIMVTPGNTYYIVCSGDAGDEANAYCWFYNNEDTYTSGEAWIKSDEMSVWTNFTHGGFNPDDYCFKTYCKKPFGGAIPYNYQIPQPSSSERPLLVLWHHIIERYPNVFPIFGNH